MSALLASIPSPGDNAIHIGALQLRAYGLMIALGVLAAVKLAQRRFVQLGVGTPEDVTSLATWGVIAGLIGARLYHVITSEPELFRDHPVQVVEMWKGGLGIPGGLLAGMTVTVWQTRKRLGRVGPALTAIAPAIPLAQAIGRLGNWWNQELFGKPTSLPWGLKIDPEFRPLQYRAVETFQPTFLYEMLWNLALCAALIWIGRHVKLRAGRLFALYVAGYSVARFVIEGMRIDPAHSFGGLRLNQWTALAGFVGSVGYLVVDRVREGPAPSIFGSSPNAPVDEEAMPLS